MQSRKGLNVCMAGDIRDQSTWGCSVFFFCRCQAPWTKCITSIFFNVYFLSFPLIFGAVSQGVPVFVTARFKRVHVVCSADVVSIREDQLKLHSPIT